MDPNSLAMAGAAEPGILPSWEPGGQKPLLCGPALFFAASKVVNMKLISTLSGHIQAEDLNLPCHQQWISSTAPSIEYASAVYLHHLFAS